MLAALALTLTACGGSGGTGKADASSNKSGGKGGADSAAPAADKKVSAAQISVSAKNGAENVATDGLSVKVAKGKLASVAVTDGDGHAVAGTTASDGSGWKPVDNLATGTTYHVKVRAKDSSGLQAAANSSFTTVSARGTFTGSYTPENGSTVGVGMPVSVRFNVPIDASKKADVQKHLKVTSTSGANIVGHWFGNQRIDFRPQEYWKPGTKVTLKMRLNGVEGENGIYGNQSRTVTFTIGRSQISTVDVAKHKMTVVRDGQTLRTLPITAGSPQHTTWAGIMVISERDEVTRMDSRTVGLGGEYDIKDVPHAQRLTDSGTFIHGNYWSYGAFGNYNASHGCVGLQDAKGGSSSLPAGWFYNKSMLGDVVIVKNSGDKTVAADNGLNGWNLSWSEWVKGSAVPASQ
ncbi:hypothetical protein BIV57_19105 [Mangrovactinospora gilvigrisea]|uniref:L,D-TPase catalytic domain-containing protein n=1 Tax=Mangrovactinospora gilvigrisea TaxID=1428644 RepID=A0A1J7C8D9_9ACTN|nr:hypothetical protein BIV57_19105 [Mangrovactinospora gilvigrisea]